MRCSLLVVLGVVFVARPDLAGVVLAALVLVWLALEAVVAALAPRRERGRPFYWVD